MNQFPLQFIDFIFVEILASIPFCLLILTRYSVTFRFVFCAGCLLLSVAGLLVWKEGWLEFGRHPAFRQLLFTTPLMLVISVCLISPWMKTSPSDNSKTGSGYLALQLLVVLLSILVPSLYQSQRIEDSIARLSQFETESRMGEFTALGRDLARIRPPLKFNDQLLREVVTQVEQQEQKLRFVVEKLSDGHDKAKLLAILGERAEAIESLQPVINSGQATATDLLLLATIFEHKQDWTKAAEWYEKAKNHLEQLPQQQPVLLISALKGIGFANRKQEHNEKAEAAYLQLLKLDPSADSHFLLAQFYQDSQVGEKAAFHLKKSVYLGGSRYRKEADEMEFQYRSYQFSCFRIH